MLPRLFPCSGKRRGLFGREETPNRSDKRENSFSQNWSRHFFVIDAGFGGFGRPLQPVPGPY